MSRILIIFALCGLAFPAAAQNAAPQPPCRAGGGVTVPAYGEIGAKPGIASWHDADLQRLGWQPPACLGWQGNSRLVAALAARFRSTESLDQLAAQLAGASHYPAIKFWAITKRAWRPMALDAWTVEGPAAQAREPDPAGATLVSGHDFYYTEDAEMAGRAVYRLRVLEHTADRLVLATENVTPIRMAILTLFEPGALQVVTFIDRAGPDTWNLYEITRASAGSSSMVSGYLSSYLNRLEAVRRYLAGQPTDGDPPIAPW